MTYTVKDGKGVTYIKNGPGSGYWSAVRHAWVKNADGTWHPIIRANLKISASTWESVYPTPQGIPFLSSDSLAFDPYQYHTQPDNDPDGNLAAKPTAVTITNTGDYELTVTAIVKNDNNNYQSTLTVPTLPVTLKPMESTSFGVRVTGLTPGSVTGNILVYSNTGVLGQVANVVPVTVNVRPDYSAITVSPNPIQLTHYYLETPASTTVTIRNSGNGANLEIFSNSSARGRITYSNLPTRIGYNFNTFQGNSSTITVTAANLAPGTYTDTLSIVSNSVDTPILSVPVSLTVRKPNGRAVFDQGGSYTWTVPDHVYQIDLFAVGGGGGGGPGLTNVAEGGSGGGGGSGGYQRSSNVSVTPGEVLSITVGGRGGKNTYSNGPYYPVTLGYAWSAFMNSYAVWTHPDGVTPTGQTVSTRRLFAVPDNGYYTVTAQADNALNFYIDEVLIVSTTSFQSSTTANVYLRQGNRKLTSNARNDGGPAGFAVRIQNTNSDVVWNTRTLLDPAAGDGGGTTTITGSFGTITAGSGAGGGAAYNSGSVGGGGGEGGQGSDGGQSDSGGGGGGGGCFLPHTLIKMADGTDKRISQVQIGDYVLEALANKPVRVIGVKTRAHDVGKWVFSLHDDEMPYITEEHPWYNDDDELCAISTLCAEQAPWLGDVNVVDVENKIKLSQEVVVYNLMLETGESHYANGIRVNNIVKTGTAYVLLYKGYISKDVYENYLYNTANKEFGPERQAKIFNILHRASRYILDNDNFKSRLLARTLAWAIANRETIQPILDKWFTSRLRKMIVGKKIK